MSPPKSNPSLASAFAFAFDGLLRTLLEERNMRIHWVCALAVSMVGMALPLPSGARVALLFGLLLVLVLEVLNAALEGVVDMATEAWSYPAKVAKDAAAGAVLVMAAGSVLVMADVLFHAWPVVEAHPEAVQRTLLLGLPGLGLLSAGLVLPRLRFSVAALGGSGACFAPLALQSEDPVFAVLGASLIVLAGVARTRAPTLLSRAAPSTQL